MRKKEILAHLRSLRIEEPKMRYLDTMDKRQTYIAGQLTVLMKIAELENLIEKR